MGYVLHPPTLTLTYTPYSLALVINDESYPQRVKVQNYAISYSSTSAPIIDNGLRSNLLYAKYQWNLVDIRLSTPEWNTLQRLHALWEDRQTAITLDDNVRAIVESGTRSRPLATGAAENSDGTTTIYRAKFSVGFSEPPSIEDVVMDNATKTPAYLISFQLSELDKLEA